MTVNREYRFVATLHFSRRRDNIRVQKTQMIIQIEVALGGSRSEAQSPAISITRKEVGVNSSFKEGNRKCATTKGAAASATGSERLSAYYIRSSNVSFFPLFLFLGGEVCVFICIYVYVCVCVYTVCMRVCMCIYMYIYHCVLLYVCVYVYIYTYISVYCFMSDIFVFVLCKMSKN